MEIRKIYKHGNSLVVSLPPRLLKELQLAEGDNVIVEVGHKGKSIVVKPLTVSQGNEHASEIGDFLENYGDALVRLKENDSTDS